MQHRNYQDDLSNEMVSKKLQEMEEGFHALKLANDEMAADLKRLGKTGQGQKLLTESELAWQPDKITNDLISNIGYSPRVYDGSHDNARPIEKKAFRSVIEHFAKDSTMPGIPKAIRAKSGAIRVFWVIMCLAAAFMFCVQFAQLLIKYYSYPKKVTVEVVPATVPFPAISLCNMRNLDIMKLNKINSIFKSGRDPQSWANMTNDTFINAYLDTITKYYPLYPRNDIDMEVFETVLTRGMIASNIERHLLVDAGVPFKELVVTCRFGGQKCNRTADFNQFFDSYYYNCFKYVAPTPVEGEGMLSVGLENGWSTVVLSGGGMLDQNDDLRYIPGTHEHFSPMMSSEGVRVVIHPQNTEPYPHTEGVDVAPGSSVSIGVQARQHLRIGQPYGNCSLADPYGPTSNDYRLISCQKKCLQKVILSKCGCKDVHLPILSNSANSQFCMDDTDIPDSCRLEGTDDCLAALMRLYGRAMCVHNVTTTMTHNATFFQECGCYPPCHEVSYDITYSLSQWPAENFDGEKAYLDIFETSGFPARFRGPEDAEKYKLYAEYFSPSNRRKAMKQFSRLNVYIKDMNVLKTEESEEYPLSLLLSDIGGQLGLWVGISLITLLEVFELIVEVFRYVRGGKRTLQVP